MALFRSEILNQDFFKAALQEAEKTRNVEILEITIGDSSSTGLQETLPVHITATVRGREKVFDWSAKISSSSQAAVELSRELKLWEKELYLYRELLPSLELRSNLVHLECPAHPDLVYSVLSDSSSALLMTDLAMAGFCPASSSQEVEVEMLELVVSWLAGLHAHSWAHFNSRLTGEKPPALMLDSVPLAGRKLSSEESLVELVASSQAPHSDYSSRLASLFQTEAYLEMCRKVFGGREGKFCTVCHGAPWLENCLVWRDGGKVREVVLTNYQQARYCQPASDLAILLYTATSKEFRQRELSRVLRGYHRTLTETLAVLGHNRPDLLYPFSDLFHDYQEAIIPAVGVAVTVLPGLVKEAADEVDIGEDRPGLTVGRTVAEKIREMMEELVENGLL